MAATFSVGSAGPDGVAISARDRDGAGRGAPRHAGAGVERRRTRRNGCGAAKRGTPACGGCGGRAGCGRLRDSRRRLEGGGAGADGRARGRGARVSCNNALCAGACAFGGGFGDLFIFVALFSLILLPVCSLFLGRCCECVLLLGPACGEPYTFQRRKLQPDFILFVADSSQFALLQFPIFHFSLER